MMLNRVSYLTDDFTSSKVFFEAGGKGDFVLVMTSERFRLVKEVILGIHAVKNINSEASFAICFDFSNASTLTGEEAILHIENFIQLSFLPACQTALNAVIFYFIPPVVHSAVEAWVHFRNALNGSFIKQGFTEVIFKPIHLLQQQQQGVLLTDFNSIHLPLSEEDLHETYYQALLQKGIIGGSLLVLHKPLETFKVIEAIACKTEIEFGKAEEVTYTLMMQNLTLQKKVKKLEELYVASTKELNNQKEYLTIYHSKSESLGINEFYFHEYEVLPLWYKRLGHIIKVMTGRRTFQSLYDKNAKKYLN
ncbi:hypothetical protein GU926_00220 [Nibribacter ruber]|uniref:Uncharacterized protein n=1 Tax=Nibribacter ruber TaxID=2698458 RepID=A0A6P1NSF6_9BACT|nr:hypothetical protein [Nibribacter ruber]QHL85950.1 hypothetical protein GU926_00220 [Nibribacter ruber]